jgi:hypothetical protein
LVVAHEVQRQRSVVGLSQHDVRAKCDTFARSRWWFDHARGLDARLQIFGLALVTLDTSSFERRPQLRHSFGRHVVRMFAVGDAW